MGLRGITIAAIVLIALSAGSLSAAQPLRPLIAGWEQYFKLDWQLAEQRGKPVVQGRIYNNWGTTALNVRLLVDELDATGNIVGQDLSWLGFQLTPGTTAPFQVRVKHPAAAYRVSVFAFDWLQRGGLKR